MAKKTFRDIACAGLERLGFVRDNNGKSTRYVEFRRGPGCDVTVIYVGRTPWDDKARVLVGQRSLRYTHGRIDESHSLNQRSVDAILTAGRS